MCGMKTGRASVTACKCPARRGGPRRKELLQRVFGVAATLEGRGHSRRAMADKGIAEHRPVLFRCGRDGKHVIAGPCGDPEFVRRGHKAVVSFDGVAGGQLVAIALKHSLDGKPAYLQTELVVLLEQVARCTAERTRIRPALVGEFKGEIEEAGVFGGGKPAAGVAARRSQIPE